MADNTLKLAISGDLFQGMMKRSRENSELHRLSEEYLNKYDIPAWNEDVTEDAKNRAVANAMFLFALYFGYDSSRDGSDDLIYMVNDLVRCDPKHLQSSTVRNHIDSYMMEDLYFPLTDPRLVGSRGVIRTAYNMTLCSAALDGSDYAKNALLKLYRTYYRREYNLVKKIDLHREDGIDALIEDDFIRDSCVLSRAVIYSMVTDGTDLDNEVYRSLLLGSCMLIESIKKNIEKYKKGLIVYDGDGKDGPQKASDILCNREGTAEYGKKKELLSVIRQLAGNMKLSHVYANYSKISDMTVEPSEYMEMKHLLSKVTKREPTDNEITVAALMKSLIDTTAFTCDNMRTLMENASAVLDAEKCRKLSGSAGFLPGCVTYSEDSGVSAEKRREEELRKKESEEKEKAAAQEETGRLRAELEQCRSELKAKENECRALKKELSEKNRALAKQEQEQKDREDRDAELNTLREYVYRMTEDDLERSSVPVEEMEETLRDMKIIIVGGHDNWTGFLKKKFPKWTYLKPSPTGSKTRNDVLYGDHVFFFTDTIAHPQYYKYINAVRTHGVPFSFLHGTNIDRTIRTVYRDMFETT